MARKDNEGFNMARFSLLKRKNLWIAVAACCGALAAGPLSTNALAAHNSVSDYEADAGADRLEHG